MKKLIKISFLVPVPFILGLVLNIVGANIENETMISIGIILMSIGTPVLMFLLVVISLILMITGRLEDKTPEEDLSEKEEYREIQEINSSYGYENNRRKDAYFINHIARNYKNATPKEKVLGWIFFGFLITDFALIMVFAFLNIFTGFLICFCVFGGTILIALIVKKILESISLSGKIKSNKKQEILHGVVKICLFSSSTSTGGSRRGLTTRIRKIVYRVIIIANNKEYTAYTKDFYETGEKVDILVKGRYAKVLEKSEENKE